MKEERDIRPVMIEIWVYLLEGLMRHCMPSLLTEPWIVQLIA